jgi:outer membrane protein
MFRTSVLLLGLAIGAFAQAKVAIINSQASVIETAELKKAQAELEAKFKPRAAQIEAIQKELAQIQQSLQAGQGKLTPQAEQDLNMRGQRKQREAQRLQEDLQAEVDRERNEILGRSSQRMQEIVKKMAEERGYDVVVDVSNTIYYKPGLEITKEATAAYDQAYPSK